MGILGSIFKGVTGNTPQTTNPQATSGLLEMLTSEETGGLHGIINQLKTNGLGNIVNSWISKGKNQPVEPNQLQNALGSEMMSKFASRMGVSQPEAANHLSKLLPTVVDKLTPDGNLPEPQHMGNIQELVKKFL